MSFFLNQRDLSTLEVNPERMKFAEIQFEAMNATLATMKKQCALKCVPAEYGENDLNKGESTCINRCVDKFMQANRLIGKYAQDVRFTERDLVHYEKIKKDSLKDL